MSDPYVKTVAEEIVEEKHKIEIQRRKKHADYLKEERAKQNIKMPRSKKAAFDLKRVKRISDLPED